MEVNPGASPFRCIDLTCCKAVALEEARRRQSSPSADAGRLRVLYRLSASTTWRPALLFRPSGVRHPTLSPTRPVFACAVTA